LAATAASLSRLASKWRVSLRDPHGLVPGEAGRVAVFVCLVTTATLAPSWRPLLALALAACVALLLARESLALLARDRTWPVLLLLALALGLIGGERDWQVGPLAFSSAGLSLGAQMTARGLAILLAVYTLTARVSVASVASLVERLGLRGFGFALGVAVNALPLVRRNYSDTWTALRLRGGFRRRRLRAVRLLLLTTMVNSVSQAEDIVAAAEARGYDPARPRRVALSWRAGDSVWLALLALAAAALLVL
jgi:energy-coupling factor transporter transmembrane protein EcfT